MKALYIFLGVANAAFFFWNIYDGSNGWVVALNAFGASLAFAIATYYDD